MATIDPVNIKLSSRCIGRFVVSMPTHASVSGRAMIQNVELYAEPMSRELFDKFLDDRARSLRGTKSKYKYLYGEGEAGVKGTRYFISLGDPNALSDGTRFIEAYKWDRGHLIKLSTNAFDWTNSVFKEHPLYKNNPIKSNLQEKAQTVIAMLARVQGRLDDEIPSEPGVCFLYGFLPGNATDLERVQNLFTLEDRVGVTINVTTDSEIKEDDSLLQRGKEIERMVNGTPGGRTLRKGVVNLQGALPAEEWLISGTMPRGALGNIFNLEGNSLNGSALTPLVTLNLHNGGTSPNTELDAGLSHASLPENEAVVLWDAVSRTLRPRPNGF
ncbi:MAG: T6SS immunity protein Tli4 family protein [Pseudomonadota bacterium]|nr:T6SS immunity protein Tli4 family protein [Pseudomonadota bacterium]